MRKRKIKILNEDAFYSKYRSPIPPHLTPEELSQWQKEMEWERKEKMRRARLGLYPNED